MAKSSIHFRPAVATSEAHNMRLTKLDYNVPELEKNNESFSLQSIDDRTREVKSHCKEVSGRKLQKNAMVIREAVVNLNPGTSMDDLKTLGNELQKQFGINCFQIHIHRDEGHKDPSTGEFKINHHAHMLFDWQDKAKGTVIKLNRVQLSQIQTLVAKVLDMERGELRVNSNRERLEPIEYKKQQAELQLEKLQQQNADLEQKKMKSEQELKSLLEKEKQMSLQPQKKPLESLFFIQRMFSPKIQQTSLNSMKTTLIKQLIGLQTKLIAYKFLLTKRNEILEMKRKLAAASPVQKIDRFKPKENDREMGL